MAWIGLMVFVQPRQTRTYASLPPEAMSWRSKESPRLTKSSCPKLCRCCPPRQAITMTSNSSHALQSFPRDSASTILPMIFSRQDLAFSRFFVGRGWSAAPYQEWKPEARRKLETHDLVPVPILMTSISPHVDTVSGNDIHLAAIEESAGVTTCVVTVTV